MFTDKESAGGVSARARRPVLTCVLVVALILMLSAWSTACGKKAGQPSSQASSGVTLVYTTPPGSGQLDSMTWDLPTGEPTTLDFVKAGDYAPDSMVSNLNDTLLRYTPDWKLGPCLAESWTTPDATTIVYQIRQGVTFWDGHPLTAADVVYSLKRNMDPKTGAINGTFYANVKSIAQTGPFEVTVLFSHPDELFNKEMGTVAGSIGEKAYIQAKGDAKYGTASGGVMGTGPYELVSWKPGSELVLKANPNYWDPALKAKVQNVTVKFIVDTSTLTSALLSGEIDGTYEAPQTAIPALKQSPNGKVYFGSSLAISELIPTRTTGPMADPQLRKALGMAIDRMALAQKVFNGAATPNKTMTPPTAWDPAAQAVYQQAWDALPALTPDIAAAKQIVAGQPEASQPIVLACLAGDQRELEIVSVVQQAAQEIGLTVKIKQMQPLDFSNLFYLPQYRKGIDLVLTLGFLDVPDPLDYLSLLLGPTALFNWIEYHNATVETNVTTARQTLDAAKRAQLIVEAQKIYTNDEVLIPLEVDPEVLFMNNRISGAPASFAYMWLPSLAMVGGTK